MIAYVLAAMATIPEPSFEEVFRHPERYEGKLIRLCGREVKVSLKAILGEERGRATQKIKVTGFVPYANCATGRLRRDPTDDGNVNSSHDGRLRQWVFESELPL